MLGHVNAGKTKFLDSIRGTTVQAKEASGITQQIRSTYVPGESIKEKTECLGAKLKYKLPGLLFIDTPGHAAFSAFRRRGSSLCDIAVLVIDGLRGLEPQGKEALDFLRASKTPFIIVLSKIDLVYGWKRPEKDSLPRSFAEALAAQGASQKAEFKNRVLTVLHDLQKEGLNCARYDKIKDFRKTVAVVPISAATGDGVSDVLALLTQLSQKFLAGRLRLSERVECTVVEASAAEGAGFILDAILSDGVLSVGDTIVACSAAGPVKTTVRALFVPREMRESQEGEVRGVSQRSVLASRAVKILASGLAGVIPGTPLRVVEPGASLDEAKHDVGFVSDLAVRVATKISTQKTGVHVQAASFGAAEALIELLDEEKIPVKSFGYGPVRRADVAKAGAQKDDLHACVLAFGVKPLHDAKELAEVTNTPVLEAETLYRLVAAYRLRETTIVSARRAASASPVFPVVLAVLPDKIFHKKSPIVLGVQVARGILKVGTPLCALLDGDDSKETARVLGGSAFLALGTVASIQAGSPPVFLAAAKAPQEVAIKITPPLGAAPSFGRHFTAQTKLCSILTRGSIDALKEQHQTDLTEDDWKLVIQLKRVHQIL